MQFQSYILSVIDMYVNAVVHRLCIIAEVILVLGLCGLLLIFSKNSCEGAKKGILFCLNVLVPSLFPFMALSGFLINSGISGKIGKPFGKLTKGLFGLNGNFAPIIILSMLGGYPVGAKGIYALFKSGNASEAEAKKAVMFCVCAGPGFVISFVGVSLYKSEEIGIVILASQIISVILLGIILSRIFKSKNNISYKESTGYLVPISSAIVKSVADSSRGVLAICAFVVIFSSFTAIIDEIINDTLFENLIFCLLEVCEAVNRASQSSPVEAVAFAVGFGGLCVHFQIFSALGDLKISKLLFFVIRIIQGVITALLTHIWLIFFPIKTTVFSSSSVDQATTFGGSIFSGIVVIMVAICFLLTLKKGNDKQLPL